MNGTCFALKSLYQYKVFIHKLIYELEFAIYHNLIKRKIIDDPDIICTDYVPLDKWELHCK